MALLTLAVSLVVTSCDTIRSPVVVPPNLWNVAFVPAPHDGGEPLLVVTISPAFPWPEDPAGGPDPVHYRVTVLRGAQPPATEVARITRTERFAVILLAPPAVERELGDEGPEQGEDDAVVAAAGKRLRAYIEGVPEPPEEVSAAIDVLARHDLPDVGPELARRIAIRDHQVVLVPYVGDRIVAGPEVGPKKADPPKYKWGTEVTDPNDPCNGKTPEACALERLKKFRDRIGNAKKPDGVTPRFPDECARLTAMLAKKPPEPKVECTRPADSGVTTGETDPLTGKISLNGEYYLTDRCADASVLHELSHSGEMVDPNKNKNFKKSRAAADKMQAAVEAKGKAIQEHDLVAFQKKAAK